MFSISPVFLLTLGLLELTLYSALIHQIWGYPLVWTVLGGLGAIAFVRVIIVSLSCSAQRNQNPRLPLKTWLFYGVQEYHVRMWIYFYYQIFYPLLLPRFRQPKASGTPVLMVHGFLCNPGFWLPSLKYFARKGLDQDCATVHLNPALADIEHYADLIHQRVESLLEETGHKQCILLAHSMGGLACRAYLRRHGSDKVKKLITLGTPHQGTRSANWFVGRNLEQMRIDNPWLQTLNQTPSPDCPIQVYYSLHDNIVLPTTLGELPVKSAQIKQQTWMAVGHMALAWDTRVLDAVYAQLIEPVKPC